MRRNFWRELLAQLGLTVRPVTSKTVRKGGGGSSSAVRRRKPMVENLEDRALLTGVDPLVSFSAAGSVDEGQPFAITVSLSEPATQTITVDYTTADGTALAGEDYTAQSGTITFATGDQTAVVEIATTDDSAGEDSEALSFSLTSASGATLPSQTTLSLTLTDTDGGVGGNNTNNSNIGGGNTTPTVQIGGAEAFEGETLVFIATLSAPSSQTVTVSYSTSGGSAQAGSDYTGGSGTVEFAPGATTAPIHILAVTDELLEGDENFTIFLSSPVNATLGEYYEDGVILDLYIPPPTISIADGFAIEGNSLVFTFTLSEASTQTVSVGYSTAGGTASEGSDYVGAFGTVDFAPGATTAQVSIYTATDNLAEGDESFTLQLSGPTNATLATSTATGVIGDFYAPPPPTLSVSDAAAGEGDELEFTIFLSDIYGQTVYLYTVYVYYYTISGMATEGVDYTGASGMVEIPAGSTSVTVSIAAIPDVISNEGDETFTLILSTSSTLNISDAQGVGAISDTPVLPPIADDQALETLEDTPLDITLAATSPSGSPLSFTIVTAPQFGSLSGSAPNLIYTPNPDYFGSDSFTFTAEENGIVSNTATVSIEVQAVSDIVADAQLVTTTEDTSVAITLTATSPSGSPLSFVIVSPPLFGTLTGDAPNLTYTPHEGYVGGDLFTFQATDGVEFSDIAEVELGVAEAVPPILAIPGQLSTNQSLPLSILLVAIDPESNPLEYYIALEPEFGQLQGQAPNLIYIPSPQFVGVDRLLFGARSESGESNLAEVSIEVLEQGGDLSLTFDSGITGFYEGVLTTMSGSALGATEISLSLTADWIATPIVLSAPVDAAGDWSLVYTFADDSPIGTSIDPIQIRLSATGGNFEETTLDAVVMNNPPELLIATKDAAGDLAEDFVEGDLVFLEMNLSDLGVEDNTLITVDWGDGTVVTFPAIVSGGSLMLAEEHLYAIPEGEESELFTLTVTADDGDGGVATQSRSVLVAANVALPTFSIESYTERLYESGDEILIEIRRRGPKEEALTVNYNLTGVAQAGVDYISDADANGNGTLVFSAGQDRRYIRLTTNGSTDDSEVEGNTTSITATSHRDNSGWLNTTFGTETILVSLEESPNYQVIQSARRATVQLVDNDYWTWTTEEPAQKTTVANGYNSWFTILVRAYSRTHLNGIEYGGDMYFTPNGVPGWHFVKEVSSTRLNFRFDVQTGNITAIDRPTRKGLTKVEPYVSLIGAGSGFLTNAAGFSIAVDNSQSNRKTVTIEDFQVITTVGPREVQLLSGVSLEVNGGLGSASFDIESLVSAVDAALGVVARAELSHSESHVLETSIKDAAGKKDYVSHSFYW